MRGLSLVVASRGHSSSRCTGLSLSRPLLLRSTGPRCTCSVVVAHGPSCSAACRILPDQGSNPRPLHWQADSQPLRHQGSPQHYFLNGITGQWLLLQVLKFSDHLTFNRSPFYSIAATISHSQQSEANFRKEQPFSCALGCGTVAGGLDLIRVTTR